MAFIIAARSWEFVKLHSCREIETTGARNARASRTSSETDHTLQTHHGYLIRMHSASRWPRAHSNHRLSYARSNHGFRGARSYHGSSFERSNRGPRIAQIAGASWTREVVGERARGVDGVVGAEDESVVDMVARGSTASGRVCAEVQRPEVCILAELK